VFIDGKSMGGRLASLLIDELAASDGVGGYLPCRFQLWPSR
jgi:predicted alpha/beta-hydrolase family hydrolase